LSFKEKIYTILSLRQFKYLIKNNNELALYIFFSRNKKFKLILKNEIELDLGYKDMSALYDFLGVLRFSVKCTQISNTIAQISFDFENYIDISLDFSLSKNKKLLKLLHEGIKYGVTFLTNQQNSLKYEKSLKLDSINGRQIVITSENLKFYLDSIEPWIFIETFILKIHEINSSEDFVGKLIVDVGANKGDTPIYYANKGAIVYAFEPMKFHYDEMIENLSLNPELGKKVIPVHAAIGQNGMMKMYQPIDSDRGDATAFYNLDQNKANISSVRGYDLRSACEEYGIKTIDLLKMDCKGCEFLITPEDLVNVKSIKIEYTTFGSHKVEELIKMLADSDFQYIIYLHDPRYVGSFKNTGHIYAIKKSN